MNYYDKVKQSQDLSQRALDWAIERLRSKGCRYPLYDTKMSPSENYEAMRRYSVEESSLVAEYMRNSNSTQTKDVQLASLPYKQWSKPYVEKKEIKHHAAWGTPYRDN
jgi:hypothetical protein